MVYPVSKWYLTSSEWLRKYITNENVSGLAGTEPGNYQYAEYGFYGMPSKLYINRDKIANNDSNHFITRKSTSGSTGSLRAAASACHNNNKALNALNSASGNPNYFNISSLSTTVNTEALGSKRLILGSDFLWYYGQYTDGAGYLVENTNQNGRQIIVNYPIAAYPSSISVSFWVSAVNGLNASNMDTAIINALNVYGGSYGYTYSGGSLQSYIYSYNVYTKSTMDIINDNKTALAGTIKFEGLPPTDIDGLWSNAGPGTMTISIVMFMDSIIESILSGNTTALNYWLTANTTFLSGSNTDMMQHVNHDATVSLYIGVSHINIELSTPDILILQAQSGPNSSNPDRYFLTQYTTHFQTYYFNCSKFTEYSYFMPESFTINGQEITTSVAQVPICAYGFSGSSFPSQLPAYMLVNYGSVN